MPENIPVANVVVFPTAQIVAIPVAYLVDPIEDENTSEAKLEKTVSLAVRKTLEVYGR
jgi:hypothetical protein